MSESIIDISIETPIPEKITFPKRDPNRLAIQDIAEGLKKYHVWLMLAYQDIKLRYRRSVLGPFWITLSMAITVYSMGFLYSHLFHTDLHSYFPYLVGGMLSWSLISTNIIELTDVFVGYESMIKQIKLPYSLYIHRIAARNIIIFFHNIIVVVPMMLIFPKDVHLSMNTLFLIPALILIYINCISYGMILAIIGARYRDVSQIIKSLIQVVFFITPVMWNPETLPADKRFIALFNPFYSFIEIIREPIIGNQTNINCYLMVAVLTVIGLLGAFKLFSRYRTRIIYWL